MTPPPSPGLPEAIRLHRCRLDDDRDIDLLQAFETLSTPERARSARFLRRRDAERYIRGRGFLRQTLGARLGLAATALELRAQGAGKPCVPGVPLEFNLSHSADRAILAVSSTGPVGIDLELLDGPARSWENLVATGRLCFTEDEMRALADLPEDGRVGRFLSFWTAKEARMKLHGEGMAMEPRTIRLHLTAGAPAGFLHDPAKPILHRIETGIPGAICHLACAPANTVGRPG